MGKKKFLTYEAQLSELGIKLEEYRKLITKLNNGRVENLGYDYIPLVNEIGYIQATNRYKWKGLPNNITSDLIESMLYYKGCVCMYYRGGTFYVLPFVNSGDINIYGRFT